MTHVAILGFNIYCEPDSLVNAGMASEALLHRFLAKVVVTNDCWLWQAKLKDNGYGQFNLHLADLGVVGAHVASHWLFIGPVPPDMQVDHLCHTRQCSGGKTCPHRACVRPSHLHATTGKANIGRGRRAESEKTHCPRQHEYTPENTVTRPNGSRTCLTCKRARENDRYRALHPGPKRNANAEKTHCKFGHEYTPENTQINSSSGARSCRTCNNERRSKGVGKGSHNASKTHCKYGHEFTPENTRINTSGGRVCLTCQAQRLAKNSRLAVEHEVG